MTGSSTPVTSPCPTDAGECLSGYCVYHRAKDISTGVRVLLEDSVDSPPHIKLAWSSAPPGASPTASMGTPSRVNVEQTAASKALAFGNQS